MGWCDVPCGKVELLVARPDRFYDYNMFQKVLDDTDYSTNTTATAQNI